MPVLNLTRRNARTLPLFCCVLLLAGGAAAQQSAPAAEPVGTAPGSPGVSPTVSPGPSQVQNEGAASTDATAPGAAPGREATAGTPATGESATSTAPTPAPLDTAAPSEEPQPPAGTRDAEPASEGQEDPQVAAMLASLDDSAAIEDVLTPDPLSIYGFADFTFERLVTKGPAAALYPQGSFFIGNLNVYLDGRLHEHWRTLAEVRFTYLPHGSLSTSTGELIDTTALDYNEGLAENRPGGIEIERAWLDYSPVPWFGVRGGQWLTPYGIWNVDHGSPTLIGIQKPYMTAVQLFPERQTGLELHGAFPLGGAFDLTLTATLSNGRGLVDAYRDLDGNKAVGGRSELQYLGAARIKLGASIYKGRYTASNTRTEVTGGDVSITLEPVTQYDELSLGGDLRVEWMGFDLLAELAMNELAFIDGRRPGGVRGLTATPQADMRRWGAYGLLGYTIEALLLMPNVGMDYIQDALTTGEYVLYRVGMRFMPIASVTLKGEYTHADPRTLLTTGGAVDTIRLQAAWAF